MTFTDWLTAILAAAFGLLLVWGGYTVLVLAFGE